MIHNYDKLTTFEAAKYNSRAAEGDIATISDTEQTFIYKNGEWQTLQADVDSNVQLTLYDINKNIISQLEDCSKSNLKKLSQDLDSWIKDKPSHYYLMLNHELRYVTMFEQNNHTKETFGDLVIECAQAIGTIKLIDIQPDFCEVWIVESDEAFALHLFPYDQGVVFYG